MVIQIDINDKYTKYLQNIDIKSYLNELIAKDIYQNSIQYQKDKFMFEERLKSANKGNTISHEEMWKKINEL